MRIALFKRGKKCGFWEKEKLKSGMSVAGGNAAGCAEALAV
jgi:hypothetical protein